MPRDTDYLTHPKQDHVRTITSGNANVEITPVNGKGDVTITIPAPGSGFGAVESVTAGTGISVSPTTGNVVVTNTGVTQLTAGSNISLSPSNGLGVVEVSATGGGGVTSITAGTGISVNAATGAVTVTNIGVTSNVAGNGISLSGGTGAVTITNNIAAGTAIGITGTNPLTIANTGVTQIVAGTNVSVSPGGGTGAVTVNVATGAGGVSSIIAGTGISVNAATGAVTVTNAGVTSNVAGNGISLSGGTGAVTITNNIAAGTGIGITGTNPLTIANSGVTSAVAGNGISLSGGTGAVTFTNNIAAGSGITITGTNPLTITSLGGPGNPYTAGDGIRIDTSTLSNKDRYLLRSGLDWQPGSANSEDQEWNTTGTTPPTGWAWMNQTAGSPSTTATMDMHTNRPSCLELTAAQSTTTAIRGIFRAVPNSGSWQYRAQLFSVTGDTATSTKTTGSGSWGSVGLAITDNSLSGLSLAILMGNTNGDLGATVYTFATPTSAASAKNTDLKGWSTASIAIIKFDGTNLFLYAADNNGMQVNLYRVTPATIGLANITTSQIGIIVHNLATTATVKAYSDYFRRDS